jgi:hypothetical protein
MMSEYKQIKVNLKHDDYEKIVAEAEALNVSNAEYIRRKILNTSYDKAPSRRRKKKCKKYDAKFLYEINRVGNNLNQIARYANSKKALDRQILDALLRIEKMLEKFLI